MKNKTPPLGKTGILNFSHGTFVAGKRGSDADTHLPERLIASDVTVGPSGTILDFEANKVYTKGTSYDHTLQSSSSDSEMLKGESVSLGSQHKMACKRCHNQTEYAKAVSCLGPQVEVPKGEAVTLDFENKNASKRRRTQVENAEVVSRWEPEANTLTSVYSAGVPILLDFENSVSRPITQPSSTATASTVSLKNNATNARSRFKRAGVNQSSQSTSRRRLAGECVTTRATNHIRQGFQQCGNTSNANFSVSALRPGVTLQYVDIGDCEHVCNHCGAMFWYGERVKGYSASRAPVYNKCCNGGKLNLPTPLDPPAYIRDLLDSQHFMDNIRAYNQMFAMTSYGAHVDETVNTRRGPYVFKISGQIYHWIGSMCPVTGDRPRFLQLYIYDTQSELSNRMSHFSSSEVLKPDVVTGLTRVLDEHNALVRIFRTARDKVADSYIPEFKIRLYGRSHKRRYDLPTSDALGAIVFDTESGEATEYDVIIQRRGGFPQRVNHLHQLYMSLQFPLLFIYGEPGFHVDIRQNSHTNNTVSIGSYYHHQLHERKGLYGLLFQCGRLFQQYVVGVYCSIEQSRLDYHRTHQNDIRKEYLSGIYDAIHRGDRVGADVGGRVILPCSFTGGPRYMYSHYLDALAICRVLGNPQFFITFTCNVNWPEIKRHTANAKHTHPSDRPDVIARVFNQKVHDFCSFLQESGRFGVVTGYLYTIEFQKRGLPHCHTLLWVAQPIQHAEEVDNYISAELPNPTTDPQAFKVVSEMMVHGPCGPPNMNAVCMQEGRCSKKFPKKYNDDTFFDKTDMYITDVETMECPLASTGLS